MSESNEIFFEPTEIKQEVEIVSDKVHIEQRDPPILDAPVPIDNKTMLIYLGLGLGLLLILSGDRENPVAAVAAAVSN